MTLLHPEALFWSLPTVLVVWAYLRARSLPSAPTATMFLWRPALEADAARSTWWPWRRLASAVAQIVLLLGLAVAMAEPYFGRPGLWILVIDASASMTVQEGSANRFDLAKARAADWLGGLSYRDRAVVILAGQPVRVIDAPSDETAELASALAKLAPARGPTTVADAVALGRSMRPEASPGGLIVFTDGCFVEAAELAASSDVEMVLVGEPRRNVALTRLAARRALGDPELVQALVELTNYADAPAKVELKLDAADTKSERLTVVLGPGKRKTETFAFRTADVATIEAVLSAHAKEDAIPGDDRATATVGPFRPTRVLLVANGARRFGLEQGLQANPSVALEVVDSWDAAKQRGGVPEEQGGYDVLVFHRRVPEPLPAQALAVIDPADPSRLWTLGTEAHNAVVAEQDAESELLQDVDLLGLSLGRAVELDWNQDANGRIRSVAQTADGRGVLFSIERDQGRIVVLLGDLADSDLPQTAAWPVLLANSVAWLTNVSGGRSPQDAPLSRTEGNTSFPSEESDLRRAAVLDEQPLAAASTENSSSPLSARIPPWTVLAAVCVLGLAVETCLFHRGWTN